MNNLNHLPGEQLQEKRYQPPQADHHDAIAQYKLHFSASTYQPTQKITHNIT